MHALAQRVLSHIRRQELLRAGERVGVAVSGGIDSAALLRLLLELRDELGIVLSVVHFNHKLRGAESDADQAFVAGLARQHGLEFYVDSDDVAAHAAEEHVSVEAAAREFRYGFFQYLIAGDGEPQELKPDLMVGADDAFESRVPSKSISTRLQKILTGHTLDDQAETVLMRLIRGSGLRGLGGIYPRIPVEDEDGEVCGEIVRPLLGSRRRELEQYLNDIGQAWREDATNADAKFTRNRVRKLVVPLLENEFNPVVAENLAELAEIARGEEDYWENEVAGWMGTAVQWSEPEWARVGSNSAGLVQIAQTPGGDDLRARIESSACLVMNASVSRMWFLGEPLAVQRRLVKAIGEQAGIPLEFKHVDEILHFAGEAGGLGKELSLPLGWSLVRRPEELVFVTPDLRKGNPPHDYEYRLSVPGRVTVHEIGMVIEARRIPVGREEGYNPEHLLSADSLPRQLTVRNWRAGDRFWPAHTKSPKKVKELLQERHVAHPGRVLWPVAVGESEIVWLRGFRVPAKYQWKSGLEAIIVVETPSADGPDHQI